MVLRFFISVFPIFKYPRCGVLRDDVFFRNGHLQPKSFHPPAPFTLSILYTQKSLILWAGRASLIKLISRSWVFPKSVPKNLASIFFLFGLWTGILLPFLPLNNAKAPNLPHELIPYSEKPPPFSGGAGISTEFYHVFTNSLLVAMILSLYFLRTITWGNFDIAKFYLGFRQGNQVLKGTFRAGQGYPLVQNGHRLHSTKISRDGFLIAGKPLYFGTPHPIPPFFDTSGLWWS